MFPRWLSWLVLGFFAYAIWSGNGTTPGAPATETREGAAGAPEGKPLPALRATLNPERWKRAINPDYAAQKPAQKPEKKPRD